MALTMIGGLITNAKLTRDNLRVREIDGKFWVVVVNDEGRIIVTYKERGYKTAKGAAKKLNELIEE